MAEKILNIYQRKNEVMKACGYLKKDSAVSFGSTSYKVVTHDAVLAFIRPHLVEHGIDMGVSVTSHSLMGKLTIADVDLILTNIDNPDEQIIYHAFAYGDNGDKGPGAAISYATKNALLKCFGIETGENDESRFEVDTKTTMPTNLHPASGVWEETDPEEQQFLLGLAAEAGELIDKGDALAAIQHIEAQKLGADERVALNTRFTSKQRSAMKKANEERKAA